MPSSAFLSFRDNCIDVERLIEAHAELNDGSPGKKGLGHITRSGVVMLCAAWELYIESLLVESTKFLVAACASPDNLPLPVQKSLAKHVRDSKHELKPLMLAGDGWKKVHITHAELVCAGVNTPKAGPIGEIYSEFIGFDDLPSKWPCGPAEVNKFVGVRGDIAHTGRSASYVKIWELENYLHIIDEAAVSSDNEVSTYLVATAPGGYKPWRVTS